jgi:hypothetical protein
MAKKLGRMVNHGVQTLHKAGWHPTKIAMAFKLHLHTVNGIIMDDDRKQLIRDLWATGDYTRSCLAGWYKVDTAVISALVGRP